MSAQHLNAALIGCGSISGIHIAAIRDSGIGCLCAICDIDPEKLRAAASIVPGAKTYTDYRLLLEQTDADVIHICTPHYLHAPMTLHCLERGKDVYLEKPAAMTYEEGKLLAAAARQTGRKICVSFQNRLTKSNLAAKQILASGRLGAIIGLKGLVTWHRQGAYYTESGWRGTWEKEGGGVLMNQAIHTLDLLYYFGGGIKRTQGSVSLRTNKGAIQVEDTAEATIWFESGATAVFYATNCHVSDSPVEIEIVCENGVLSIRDDILFQKKNGAFTPIAKNGGVKIGKSCWGEGHRDMISNYYHALMGGDHYYCGIEDGIAVQKVIEDIYRSSKENLRG